MRPPGGLAAGLRPLVARVRRLQFDCRAVAGHGLLDAVERFDVWRTRCSSSTPARKLMASTRGRPDPARWPGPAATSRAAASRCRHRRGRACPASARADPRTGWPGMEPREGRGDLGVELLLGLAELPDLKPWHAQGSQQPWPPRAPRAGATASVARRHRREAQHRALQQVHVGVGRRLRGQQRQGTVGQQLHLQRGGASTQPRSIPDGFVLGRGHEEDDVLAGLGPSPSARSSPVANGSRRVHRAAIGTAHEQHALVQQQEQAPGAEGTGPDSA